MKSDDRVSLRASPKLLCGAELGVFGFCTSETSGPMRVPATKGSPTLIVLDQSLQKAARYVYILLWIWVILSRLG